MCMHSPDLLTPLLSHEPAPEVLDMLILSSCTTLGIYFHLKLLSLLFISLVLGTVLVSLNRRNRFQCHLKCCFSQLCSVFLWLNDFDIINLDFSRINTHDNKMGHMGKQMLFEEEMGFGEKCYSQ